MIRKKVNRIRLAGNLLLSLSFICFLVGFITNITWFVVFHFTALILGSLYIIVHKIESLRLRLVGGEE